MLNTRYKEHTLAIRNNHSNSRYSNHALNIGHNYGTIADPVNVSRAKKKGKHLNTLERHQDTKKDNLHMDKIHIHTFNPMFETLHELHNRKKHVFPPPLQETQ
jgi:hypothetical protein